MSVEQQPISFYNYKNSINNVYTNNAILHNLNTEFSNIENHDKSYYHSIDTQFKFKPTANHSLKHSRLIWR